MAVIQKETIRTSTVAIAGGESLSTSSGELDGRLIGVTTDAAWDTQAMTFQASTDGTNFFNLYNQGTEYSLAGVVASAHNRVDVNVFLGVRYVKVRSGTAASAENQGDATTVTLVYWKIDEDGGRAILV